MPVHANANRVVKLVEDVLAVSHEIHPEYTHDEHWAWCAGLLAVVVLEKNHMDSIVFRRLHERLNELTKSRRFPLNF